MGKVFYMICMMSLLVLNACVNESNIDSCNLLKYEGENSVSKLLVQKIQERNGSQELHALLSFKQHEVLLDYVLLQYGFGEGIHYLIPVKNVNSGEINGCIIYRVNKESSKKYLSMSDLEQKMKSVTFKKWKEQGLNVNVMLYNDELLMSRALTEKEMNKQESTISSIDATVCEGEVFYSFSLNDYLPDDVDS